MAEKSEFDWDEYVAPPLPGAKKYPKQEEGTYNPFAAKATATKHYEAARAAPRPKVPDRLLSHVGEIEASMRNLKDEQFTGDLRQRLNRLKSGKASDVDTETVGALLHGLAAKKWTEHSGGSGWLKLQKDLENHGASKGTLRALDGLGSGEGNGHEHIWTVKLAQGTLRDKIAAKEAQIKALESKVAGVGAKNKDVLKWNELKAQHQALRAHHDTLGAALKSVGNSQASRLREIHKAYNWHRLGTGLDFDHKVHGELDRLRKAHEVQKGKYLTDDQWHKTLANSPGLQEHLKKHLVKGEGGYGVHTWADGTAYSKELGDHVARSIKRYTAGPSVTGSKGKVLVDTDLHAKFAKVSAAWAKGFIAPEGTWHRYGASEDADRMARTHGFTDVKHALRSGWVHVLPEGENLVGHHTSDLTDPQRNTMAQTSEFFSNTHKYSHVPQVIKKPNDLGETSGNGLNGWISPDGKWHPNHHNEMYGHDEIARGLGFDSKDDAHAAGYMHVAHGGDVLHGSGATEAGHTGMQIARLKDIARRGGYGSAEVNQIVAGKHRQLVLRLAKVRDARIARLIAAALAPIDPTVT